jgi:hypothetical protein
VLLADPRTVSFAAGAHKEGRSTDELCGLVAAALKARSASWAERHMAVVAAAMRGRYRSMVSAMEQADLEPVVIEDLVKFGEDRGLRKGELRADRSALRRVLALRKLELSAEQEQQIKTCTDLPTLRRWLDQAIFAESAVEGCGASHRRAAGTTSPPESGPGRDQITSSSVEAVGTAAPSDRDRRSPPRRRAVAASTWSGRRFVRASTGDDVGAPHPRRQRRDGDPSNVGARRYCAHLPARPWARRSAASTLRPGRGRARAAPELTTRPAPHRSVALPRCGWFILPAMVWPPIQSFQRVS